MVLKRFSSTIFLFATVLFSSVGAEQCITKTESYKKVNYAGRLIIVGALKQLVTCGTETKVTLPLNFPNSEQCEHCDQFSLEIKQLDGNFLPNVAFKDFKKTTEIHLCDLGIAHISESAFDGLENCEEIYLSGNNLSEILPEVFKGLKQLKKLDFSNNNIRDVNNKFLVMLPNENLVSLNFSRNKIDFIDEQLSGKFENLISLDLSFNEIAFFNFDYLSDGVSVLNISHNRLSQLTVCFYKVSHLILSNNNLRTIHNGCFNQTVKTNYLDISHNQITNLNFDMFPENAGIEVFLIDHNNIANIPLGSFSHLTQLNILNLSSNKIKCLSQGSFESLENLRHLDLSNNFFKNVDFNTLHNLPSLREFSIKGNLIGNFNYKMLPEAFPTLQLVDLDNNNFTCDYLVEMVFYLKQKTIDIVQGSTKYSDNINGISCYNKLIPKNNIKFLREDKTIQVEFLSKNSTKYKQQIFIFWISIVILTLLLLILAFQIYIVHYKCQYEQLEDVEMS